MGHSGLFNICGDNFKLNFTFKRHHTMENPNLKEIKLKQDQGSKAPSRDHPNSSFMTRLDYIRVED